MILTFSILAYQLQIGNLLLARNIILATMTQKIVNIEYFLPLLMKLGSV